LIAVVGPTGAGKSELGRYLAARLNGEIVNCDSVQIYRHFNIGTAKTPAHLVDIAGPDEIFTAGEYARRARTVLGAIASRGHIPVVVGGTGFYLRALLEGLFPGPERDDSLRARLIGRERRRPASLHRILTRLDPPSAARIHPNDVNKIIRALEVRLKAQQPLSKMLEKGREPLAGFRIIKVGLDPPRDDLYARLDKRFASMIENGLLDEVRQILASGVSPAAKPFESLGYKQALAVVREEISLDDAIESAQMETRRYAKRQMTWFRREPSVTWFPGFGDCPGVQKQVLEFAKRSFQLSNESTA
jgi:tRNA dimethylallyltransferase